MGKITREDEDGTVAASNDVRIIMPGQKWDSGVGNNGPHCGLQLVNNANALENQLFKEAKHTLVHELNSRKALGTLGRRRPRAGPEAVVYDVTSNAYGNAWQTPATLSGRVKAAALALDPKSTSRATKVQNRPPTNIKGPETNEHGSPVVYYPWATPERDKVPRSHVPISGWKDKTRAPWIVAEGSKEKFQDMIGCPGGFGPRPARVVLKKEKSRPSPFCVERMPKQSRHEMCSSIAQQPAHLDPGCGTATRTLGTQENALSSNLRERGGPAWASYLKGANPILQFRDDHLLSAVPHRSIARLVKRTTRNRMQIFCCGAASTRARSSRGNSVRLRAWAPTQLRQDGAPLARAVTAVLPNRTESIQQIQLRSKSAETTTSIPLSPACGVPTPNQCLFLSTPSAARVGGAERCPDYAYGGHSYGD